MTRDNGLLLHSSARQATAAPRTAQRRVASRHGHICFAGLHCGASRVRNSNTRLSNFASTSSRITLKMDILHVIVVGGGFAGLSAVRTLLELGKSVLLMDKKSS
ncbi:hypothetical protein GGX14DRAFT_561010 [Mycena pura]|uniref:Alanine dehydrogenase/pyridine nucleotide transhydrogenase NAD(H)-binding domain-containing protein n=1 Tax=Mycena pura TaxID=153505 RepID=A0AAD6VP52_9AGAR|nr:hypothetical protein GGX14DRAFT_561010 [Mycena pura]